MWIPIIQGAGEVFSKYRAYKEMKRRRKLYGDIEKIKNYLVELNSKVDRVIAQNQHIIDRLNAIPGEFGRIVDTVVEEKFLDEKFSRMKAVLLVFRSLKGDDWEIGSDWLMNYIEALTYVSEHEQRFEKVFQIPFWADFAIALTKGALTNAVSIIVSERTESLARLSSRMELHASNMLDDIQRELDQSEFVSSHNFNKKLKTLAAVSVKWQPDRTKTVTRSREVCRTVTECCRRRQVCHTENYNETVPDRAFSAERDRRRRAIERRISAASDFISEYADIKSLLEQLSQYGDWLESGQQKSSSAEFTMVDSISAEELGEMKASGLDVENAVFFLTPKDCY